MLYGALTMSVCSFNNKWIACFVVPTLCQHFLWTANKHLSVNNSCSLHQTRFISNCNSQAGPCWLASWFPGDKKSPCCAAFKLNWTGGWGGGGMQATQIDNVMVHSGMLIPRRALVKGAVETRRMCDTRNGYEQKCFLLVINADQGTQLSIM